MEGHSRGDRAEETEILRAAKTAALRMARAMVTREKLYARER